MDFRSKRVAQTFPKPHPLSTKKYVAWYNPTDRKIYNLLKERGLLSRADLVKQTGLPRTTLFDALRRLAIEGLITQFSEQRKTPGRPRVFYKAIISYTEE